jgi:hypothetical protein
MHPRSLKPLEDIRDAGNNITEYGFISHNMGKGD